MGWVHIVRVTQLQQDMACGNMAVVTTINICVDFHSSTGKIGMCYLCVVDNMVYRDTQ